MADATKIQLGPGTLTLYHPTLGTLDLGHTIGGITVTYAPEYHETSVDKYGSSVVEKFLVGERMSAETNLAEWSLPNLRAAFADGTLAGDDSVSVGSAAGKRVSSKAGLLVIHPDAAGSSRDYDIGIYKAVQTNEIAIELSTENEKMIPVNFDGLVDETRADGNMLGFIGDSIA